MAKKPASGLPNRLAGKRFVFSGKFGYGVEDSLKELARLQQGIVCDDLDPKVDYLVLADLNAGKTVQKKAMTLNGKGAAIQVIDVDNFKTLSDPTDEEVLALIRAGESEKADAVRRSRHSYGHSSAPEITYCSEDFSSTKLMNFDFSHIHFDGCTFKGSTIERVTIRTAKDCDFSNVSGEANQFFDVPGSRFRKAKLKQSWFTGEISGADFTGATLENGSIGMVSYFNQNKQAPRTNVSFADAKLNSVDLHHLHLKSADFTGADLTGCKFHQCVIESGMFRNAILRDAVLVGCKLQGADLTNVDFTGANLGDADLTGAKLTGANLKDANLRSTKLDGVDLSKVKNYDPQSFSAGVIGPALQELDNLCSTAKKIAVVFHLRSSNGEPNHVVAVDSSRFQWGCGIHFPSWVSPLMFRFQTGQKFSDAMMQLANVAGHLPVCFETVDVSSTKSPKGGKELRELVMKGIVEAFAQELPSGEDLAAATKEYRDAEREKTAAHREQLQQAREEAAKQKEKAKKQIAKKVEKAVGKVSDVASFLKALEVRIEKPKIDKATSMLRASGFKLFNDVTDQYVTGVVKSQTDPDLVYACRVADDGQYSCCTQNLNICGGLRGSICKHTLVLIIGLVQAGELDPTTIDEWIAKTHTSKPVLDKETMGAIFIKYKGAEAGEVDWRPTETVPEDYYAL